MENPAKPPFSYVDIRADYMGGWIHRLITPPNPCSTSEDFLLGVGLDPGPFSDWVAQHRSMASHFGWQDVLRVYAEHRLMGSEWGELDAADHLDAMRWMERLGMTQDASRRIRDRLPESILSDNVPGVYRLICLMVTEVSANVFRSLKGAMLEWQRPRTTPNTDLLVYTVDWQSGATGNLSAPGCTGLHDRGLDTVMWSWGF
jgi:hypothetical protein